MLSAALCVGCWPAAAAAITIPSILPPPAARDPLAGIHRSLSGTVNTNGSTSMESVMGYLTEGFKEVQPGITVNYTGSGSSAGVTAPRTAPATSAWPPAT